MSGDIQFTEKGIDWRKGSNSLEILRGLGKQYAESGLNYSRVQVTINTHMPAETSLPRNGLYAGRFVTNEDGNRVPVTAKRIMDWRELKIRQVLEKLGVPSNRIRVDKNYGTVESEFDAFTTVEIY